MNRIKSILDLSINSKLYAFLGGISFCFCISFFFPKFYLATWFLLILFFVMCMTDLFLLFFPKKNISVERICPEKLSNGDQNSIQIIIKNQYSFGIKFEIIDETPFQFQIRNFGISGSLLSNETKNLKYQLRPTERGLYDFGKTIVFVASPIGLIQRKLYFSESQKIPCYPSFLQLRKYDLMAFSNKINLFGLKKIRKIGHTLEFEQIKEYVLGDDIRTINWKSTAKKNQLMINQFQDEKSQSVYFVIDKSRSMQMPFDGLSLLDYAINATLVMSHIVLKKQDKAGLFTFSNKVENSIIADKKNLQLHKIIESLYKIETNFFESDFDKIYTTIKTKINQRSLIVLFTNFESTESLERQLPYLKAIAKNHLLMVVFFENTILSKLIHQKSSNLTDIYDKLIAEKFAYEKKLITLELRKYGIIAISSKPENLTVDTLNKYLEIKSRGLL